MAVQGGESEGVGQENRSIHGTGNCWFACVNASVRFGRTCSEAAGFGHIVAVDLLLL